jgi:hypothetical protein
MNTISTREGLPWWLWLVALVTFMIALDIVLIVVSRDQVPQSLQIASEGE